MAIADTSRLCKNAALGLSQGDPLTKPILDKAEIALEYPDKLYVGTFERSSRFEAHLDSAGISLTLERPGADDVRKSIHMHIRSVRRHCYAS